MVQGRQGGEINERAGGGAGVVGFGEELVELGGEGGHFAEGLVGVGFAGGEFGGAGVEEGFGGRGEEVVCGEDAAGGGGDGAGGGFEGVGEEVAGAG